MKKLLGVFGFFVILIVTVFIVGLMSLQVMAQPNGAGVTEGSSERAPEDSAGSASAFAGNTTELTVMGDSITQSWQGYFGNVTGAIQLSDASGNALYNWTLADPSGEIYASTNDTVTWNTIQCFNFTANGTQAGSGGETAGATNLAGLNLSQLESAFNIASDDADGVDSTFGFTITHDEFFTGSLQFNAGECPATAAYDSTGQSVDGNFEEALLYEPSTGSLVFAAILEEGSVNGFNSGDHDFEMLVLEDGHSGDTSATTYYFYVELD